MSPNESFRGQFNARWLHPEQVARLFVLTPRLDDLVNAQSAILMGPRGCGKTTLLKMLTVRALRTWAKERADGGERDLPQPAFRAVYVPSDLRWSQELPEFAGEEELTGLVQRVLVNLSLASELISEISELEFPDRASLVDWFGRAAECLGLHDVGAEVGAFRFAISLYAARVRAAIYRRDLADLRVLIDAVPPALMCDSIGLAGLLVDAATPSCGFAMPPLWALCFDELELAPAWLQQELLASLRSRDQRFLLKLTWSPVLPQHLMGSAERDNDYKLIRLWYSHASDAESFCEDLANRELTVRFPGKRVTPTRLLGRSIFAEEDRPGDGNDVYARGSSVQTAMISLAERDLSFRRALREHGLDPADPFTETPEIRDQFLRKIKPIVLLRETFWGPERSRSRKRPTIYSGKEVLYGMSEGNPRRLLRLLSDLLLRLQDGAADSDSDGPLISPAQQAREYVSASQTFKSFIRAVPASETHPGRGIRTLMLADFVDRIGEYFSGRLLGEFFHEEYLASFRTTERTSAEFRQIINVGLRIGAFIAIGRSQGDVPISLDGAHYRLTFMLAPAHRLLLRNGKPVALESCFPAHLPSTEQMPLFEAMDGVSEDEEMQLRDEEGEDS